MRTRCGRALLVGLLLAGLLSGCATTVVQQENVGLPTAENPEYLAHPFRLVALALHATGNILRYGLVEPLYFAMNTMPDFVGLFGEGAISPASLRAFFYPTLQLQLWIEKPRQ